ncbi:CHASE2 domain-containing protein [Marinobacterium weihaiense]|uniref:CHASE2 domain-containing protein n=1 Tax=Marinobacterium weihaiense TaxID=2851016 RepID=A0ABS6MDV2_9GAMM|nr:CHASE2 domain-containing protein [Marinobacterium weihaiense]MBV0934486.1 CHASE2 domain-containing protein [Marinobacterium weihaiense]
MSPGSLISARALGPGLLVVAWVLVLIGSALGAFSLPNAWLYRQYHLMSPQVPPAPRVVLVEVERSGLTRDGWLSLIRQVNRAGARAVAVLERPPALSEADEHQLLQQRVLMGRSTVQANNRYPFLVLPPSYRPELNGLHRVRIELNGHAFVSLEAALASTVIGRPADPAPLLIDFRPGSNYLPTLQASRILRGDLTRDLLHDKVVLIGLAPDPIAPPILTPLPVDAPIYRLDHAGYAVETLLQGRPVQPMPAWQSALVLLLGLVLAAAIHMRFGVRHALLFCVLGTVLPPMAGWWALHFLGQVWPVTEMMVLTWAVWLLLVRREQRTQSYTVGRMLREASHRLQERLQPEDFNASADPWGQIMLLVTQVLNLERAILLERIPQGRHVREIKAYNCSIDDIDERRRDFGRTPYSTALREGGPILLQRTYLREREGDGRQFLAPLQFNGQVLGFFSGEVSARSLEHNPMFMSMLQSFSLQISELLYQRQQWQARQRLESSRWMRLLRLESVDTEYRALQQASSMMERRLTLLEKVINGLETGTVMYDPFGRVLQVNRRTEALISRAELPIFSWTAADFLAVLVSIPIETARQYMQQLVRDDQPLVLSARLPNGQGSFLLYARALREQTDTGDSQRPFNLIGFLFELVDTRHLNVLGEHESRVIEHALNEIEQDLTRVPGTAVAPVVRKLVSLRTLQAEMRQRARLEYYPISVLGLLGSLQQRWQPALSEQGMTVQWELLEQDVIVRVDLMRVDGILDGLMALLQQDALEGSCIRLTLMLIDAERDTPNTWLTLSLNNQGYGMPNDRLQAALTAEVADRALQAVSLASRALQEWGGELTASAALGHGLAFKLHLPCRRLDQIMPGSSSPLSAAAPHLRDAISE